MPAAPLEGDISGSVFVQSPGEGALLDKDKATHCGAALAIGAQPIRRGCKAVRSNSFPF